jgi:Tfp pilus assembly ATPase PilU
LHVEVGGEIVLPTDFILTSEKFILSGRLVGVDRNAHKNILQPELHQTRNRYCYFPSPWLGCLFS